MSNEEQAVLDFFAQVENLPLALSLAEQLDSLRQQMNNAYWLGLRERISALAPGWKVQITEDRDAENCLVGLNLQQTAEQALSLRPMMEQQITGGVPRIYFGLMWVGTPAPEATQIAEVGLLRAALRDEGFKSNEKFLAWRWTPYYARRKDFMLRYSNQTNAFLDESAGLLKQLLIAHGASVQAINTILQATPKSAPISLGQLRTNLDR
jgi:hypothetical protein